MRRSDQSTTVAERRFVDVARTILASIHAGQYAPAARLPGDRELAVTYGVSRSTAREALLALELIGAIVVRHGDGVYVSTSGTARIDETSAILDGEPRHLIESRRVLEPITTRLAAGRITPEQLDHLTALVDEAERLAPDLTDFQPFTTVGFAFHSELAKCSGNALLAEFVGQLVSVEQHPLWVLVNEQVLRSPAARLAQVAEHRAVVDALRDHDESAAELCMHRHLFALEGSVFPGDTVG
jgi:DNA-binding FadR family transcriptional regulator